MIFSADGVSPDRKKIAAITNAPRSTTVSGVRSITTPLRQLTKKNARIQWLPAHESAWKTLTRALTSAPVMAYFDTNKCTELIVDASLTGLGAILQQHTPDKQDHKVIAYASRALSPVEQRYSQTEREALAIVWAMERFHIYLCGTEFVLYADHKPLELICNNPKSKHGLSDGSCVFASTYFESSIVLGRTIPLTTCPGTHCPHLQHTIAMLQKNTSTLSHNIPHQKPSALKKSTANKRS